MKKMNLLDLKSVLTNINPVGAWTLSVFMVLSLSSHAQTLSQSDDLLKTKGASKVTQKSKNKTVSKLKSKKQTSKAKQVNNGKNVNNVNKVNNVINEPTRVVGISNLSQNSNKPLKIENLNSLESSLPAQKMVTTLKPAAEPAPFPLETTFVGRYFQMPKDQTMADYEIFSEYSFNKHVALSIYLEYDQFFDPKLAVNNDLQDTEFKLQLSLAPELTTYTKWDLKLGLYAIAPSSKASQTNTEIMGLGAEPEANLSLGKFDFVLKSKQIGYIYNQDYVRSTTPVVISDLSGDGSLFVDDSTFNNFKSSTALDAVSYTPNYLYYADNIFRTTINLHPKFKLRADARLENRGFADDHFSNKFHTRFSAGVFFTPNVFAWLSVDNAKNTDSASSIYTDQNTMTFLSLYLVI